MYKETIGNRKHGLENKSAFDASNRPRFHVVGSWVLDEVSRYILLFFLAVVLSSLHVKRIQLRRPSLICRND